MQPPATQPTEKTMQLRRPGVASSSVHRQVHEVRPSADLPGATLAVDADELISTVDGIFARPQVCGCVATDWLELTGENAPQGPQHTPHTPQAGRYAQKLYEN